MVALAVTGCEVTINLDGLGAVDDTGEPDDPGPEIYRGTPVQNDWAVALSTSSRLSDTFCTGTLIAPNAVLTSQHCWATGATPALQSIYLLKSSGALLGTGRAIMLYTYGQSTFRGPANIGTPPPDDTIDRIKYDAALDQALLILETPQSTSQTMTVWRSPPSTCATADVYGYGPSSFSSYVYGALRKGSTTFIADPFPVDPDGNAVVNSKVVGMEPYTCGKDSGGPVVCNGRLAYVTRGYELRENLDGDPGNDIEYDPQVHETWPAYYMDSSLYNPWLFTYSRCPRTDPTTGDPMPEIAAVAPSPDTDWLKGILEPTRTYRASGGYGVDMFAGCRIVLGQTQSSFVDQDGPHATTTGTFDVQYLWDIDLTAADAAAIMSTRAGRTYKLSFTVTSLARVPTTSSYSSSTSSASVTNVMYSLDGANFVALAPVQGVLSLKGPDYFVERKYEVTFDPTKDAFRKKFKKSADFQGWVWRPRTSVSVYVEGRVGATCSVSRPTTGTATRARIDVSDIALRPVIPSTEQPIFFTSP